jgi:phosphate starvation-inducible PhoH-like protein
MRIYYVFFTLLTSLNVNSSKLKSFKLTASRLLPFTLTENQMKYNTILNSNTDFLLSVIGPAGSGKTHLACVKAINQLKENKINKIILTRPVVNVGEEQLGFLPGNVDKKMNPYVRPIYDIFSNYYSLDELNQFIKNGKIEISPLGFMRGRTFTNSFIIADEMQNSTPEQMKMLLTRIGLNTCVVLTGDLEQSDLKEKNGLSDLISKMKNQHSLPDNFHYVQLNDTDVMRSEIVNNILKIYNEVNEENNIKNELLNENITMNVNNTTTTTNNYKCCGNNCTSSLNRNNDAALIPLHHMRKLVKYNDKYFTNKHDYFL